MCVSVYSAYEKEVWLLTDKCDDVLLVRILSPGGMVRVNIQSDACRGKSTEINTLEHVQVRQQF